MGPKAASPLSRCILERVCDVGYLFYFFLLIAIINLVANAVRRARSGEGYSRYPGQTRPAATGRLAGDRPGPEKAPPGEAKAGLPQETDRSAAAKAGDGLRSATSPRSRTLKEAVPVNVARIFDEKEQLLAAFIFHELIGPPRSLRPRRTPPFAKGGPGGI